jgi:hypothetical protein
MINTDLEAGLGFMEEIKMWLASKSKWGMIPRMIY